MAPQHPRSFARQLQGDLTPGYPGTGPLAGGDTSGSLGLQLHGVPAAPAHRSSLRLSLSDKSLAAFVPGKKHFFLPMESKGSLTRGTGQGHEPTSAIISQPPRCPLGPCIPPSIPALQSGSSRPGHLLCWDNDFNITMAFGISVCSTSGVSHSHRILALLGWLLNTNLHYFPPL